MTDTDPSSEVYVEQVAWLYSPTPVLIVSPTHSGEEIQAVVTEINPAAAAVFNAFGDGSSTLNDLFGEHNSAILLNELHEAFSHQQAFTTELAYAREKDGPASDSVRWYSISLTPINVQQPLTDSANDEITDVDTSLGSERAGVLTAVDVTDRRATEIKLRESEAVLRLATSAGGVGTWMLEVASGVLTIDPMAAQILGTTTSAVQSMEQLKDLVDPDDRGIFESEGRLEQDGLTCRVRPENKPMRIVLIRGRSFGSGNHARLAGTIVDISSTHDLSNRLDETLESISDAYFALDSQWNVIYANLHAQRLVQLDTSLAGMNFWTLFPVENSTLETNLRHAMTSRTLIAMEGSYVPRGAWYEVRAFPLRDGLGVYFSDITDRKSVEQQRDRLLASEREARLRAEEARQHIAFQARHDALTGLLNRAELTKELKSHLTDAGSSSAAVMFVDIDHFKWVNDSFGHAFGDQLLMELADRFVPLVRHGDTVARFGGDEFVIVLFDTTSEQAEVTARRMAEAARKPVHFDGQSLEITVSIGLALQNADATAESLIRDADVALYRAKESGRNQVSWFHIGARDALAERARVESQVRTALAAGQLVVHYQPSWSLATGHVIDLEALVRWNHPQRGLLGAHEFVPMIEKTPLIEELGTFVLNQAIAEAARWQEHNKITLWVNVSPRQLTRPGLTDQVLEALEKYGLPTSRFGIEIIETTLVDAAAAGSELQRLHDAGVRIAIDDYGTGYSSLSRLQRLPLDLIKLDRSLLSDVRSAKGRALIDSVVQLATALGVSTVAEGIEYREQLHAVRELGCTSASGHLLAQPMPVAELVDYLASRESQLGFTDSPVDEESFG